MCAAVESSGVSFPVAARNGLDCLAELVALESDVLVIEDNDLNMICLAGLIIGHALAWGVVKTSLATRHRRRLSKVAELENKEART